jgi:thioredoxin-like negative regulator of GroEL
MILFKDGKPVGKQVGYKAFSQLVDFIDNN